jgi:hypothetical protein
MSFCTSHNNLNPEVYISMFLGTRGLSLGVGSTMLAWRPTEDSVVYLSVSGADNHLQPLACSCIHSAFVFSFICSSSHWMCLCVSFPLSRRGKIVLRQSYLNSARLYLWRPSFQVRSHSKVLLLRTSGNTFGGYTSIIASIWKFHQNLTIMLI